MMKLKAEYQQSVNHIQGQVQIGELDLDQRDTSSKTEQIVSQKSPQHNQTNSQNNKFKCWLNIKGTSYLAKENQPLIIYLEEASFLNILFCSKRRLNIRGVAIGIHSYFDFTYISDRLIPKNPTDYDYIAINCRNQCLDLII
ncbi:unnamed protein product (macronuclear) [Paramecium tetraurelia]|uniref:Uncharacterized protein n=1 Tax=Paramecium tetraurelia TaxID=5888 RepID=A0C1T3_PARTE|nr:uncharacterized protein GSPATT00034227001 [Paramecium tetraurelia]CAK64750.1 unnamed protein product [Paramecium tetraurelia]|eukprot:XP_001432147.1 hypothetical protein (macronuclear) [Paramecium tetraurelia strain d4-2]